MRWRILSYGSAIAVAVTLAPMQADAAFTPIMPPPPGEDTHQQILSSVYGGTFNPGGPNAFSFTNGLITAVRINDSVDDLWFTSGFDATARAVFAHFDQKFGYFEGESGGSFTELFAVSGNSYAVSGAATDVVIDGNFRFARSGNQGTTVTSSPADNPGGFDHMVTYRIDGINDAGKLPVYLLFFEDRRFNNSDFDYTDLVVEVRGANIIPTPAAFGAGLMMIAGALLRRRS
jgi:hypothetical protein